MRVVFIKAAYAIEGEIDINMQEVKKKHSS
jgi:hypothetical protein